MGKEGREVRDGLEGDRGSVDQGPQTNFVQGAARTAWLAILVYCTDSDGTGDTVRLIIGMALHSLVMSNALMLLREAYRVADLWRNLWAVVCLCELTCTWRRHVTYWFTVWLSGWLTVQGRVFGGEEMCAEVVRSRVRRQDYQYQETVGQRWIYDCQQQQLLLLYKYTSNNKDVTSWCVFVVKTPLPSPK